MITKLREKFKINRKYLKCKISLNAVLIGIDYINIGINTTILYGTRIQAVSIWKNKRYTPNIVIGRNVNIEQKTPQHAAFFYIFVSPFNLRVRFTYSTLAISITPSIAVSIIIITAITTTMLSPSYSRLAV